MHKLTRVAAIVAVGALAAGPFAALPAGAVGATGSTETAKAAVSSTARNAGGALARYLASHENHFSTTFDGTEYADYGLTLDGVLALDAAKVGQTQAQSATAFVGDNQANYAGTGDEIYAGATAKALLAAQAQQASPANTLAGINLLTRLKKTEQPSGRFKDVSQIGDYSNMITESLAVVAVKRSGSALSAQATRYLRIQQCSNGGFTLQLNDQGCTDPSKAETDATAFAIQGLLATPDDKYRKTRITNAAVFLKNRMNSYGGVGGGPSTTAPNANSTGLAAWAFASAGHPSLAAKARSYNAARVFGCSAPAALRGLVAYDYDRFQQVKQQGSAAKVTDQDLRATTQAVLGFADSSLLQISKSGATTSAPAPSC